MAIVADILLKGTNAARLALTLDANQEGVHFFESDTLKTYRWDGSAWDLIADANSTTYTDEKAQDAVGGMVADTDTVDLTYTDATPELKADVKKQMSITSDSSGLKLVNDETSPGNDQVYGTDASGVKGWKDDPAGGGGGVDDAEYIVSAAHGDLTAEVVIPGLAGNADIAGTGRAGVAHEFDSGGSPFTWSRAIDTENVDSTVKSHLWIEDNGTTEALGTYAWSPAGAFDIRVKVSLGTEMGTTSDIVACGLIVGDSAMNNRVLCQLEFAGATDRFQVSAYTYAGSYITRGAVQTGMGSVIYLRIVRDGSNNNSFYYSSNGLNWLLIATQSLTYTAAKAGLRLDPSPSAVTTNAAIDWIGSDV